MIVEWDDDGWRRRFALIPIYLSDGSSRRLIWLQRVWMRFAGLYTEVSLTDPRPAIATDTRRAETGTGSVHEGAGLKGIANTSLPPNPEQTEQ